MSNFRPFSNASTGERIEYTAVAEDNGGDLLRLNWSSAPGGVIPGHVHPNQEERFIITAGEAQLTLNGEEHVVRAGETLVVPPGVRHSESNPGSVEVQGVVELRPALHTKEMFEAFAGLVADGKTRPNGLRRTHCSSARHTGTSATKAA